MIGPGGTSTSMIKLGGTKEIPHGEGDKIMKQAEIEKNDDVVSDEKEQREKEKVVLDQLLVKLKDTIENGEILKDFKET